jgi:hypothetical protein
MWSEEIFNVATAYCMALGAFFQEVAKTLGNDRALEMLIEQRRRFFKGRARTVQQLMERQEFDLKTFAGKAEKAWQHIGFESIIKPTSTSLISTTRKCPFYAGFLAAGVNHSTIEAYCRGKDKAGDAQYRQFVGPYAGLKMRKFRSGSDDYCIEEVILKPNEA